MYEEVFPARLAQLRIRKGVSARDMSLSIGQNAGYINNIETGKALPSMAGFFFICEYLDISPREFFDTENKRPNEMRRLLDDLNELDDVQFNNIASIVAALAAKQ